MKTEKSQREKCSLRKGKKGLRGVAYNEYGEVKQKISVTLLPFLIKRLDAIAIKNNQSRSECIEQILRKELGDE